METRCTLCDALLGEDGTCPLETAPWHDDAAELPGPLDDLYT
jgi:hypothetical protein